MGRTKGHGGTMQRTKRALAGVVMMGTLLGLGGAVSEGGATASAAPTSSRMASGPTGTAAGEVSPLRPVKKFVTCVNDGGYVERGANQTVPRLDVATQGEGGHNTRDDVIVGPIIAWSTVSDAFGSRAVVSMFIVITPNQLKGNRWWRVSWYCTSDKNKAWLVFGATRTAPQVHQSSRTSSGRLPAGTSTTRFASCGDEYVERGDNQTVSRRFLQANSSVGPIIAWDTSPNAFGSRAVRSMIITIHNVDTTDSHYWEVTWYCTPDKSKAWLVFG